MSMPAAQIQMVRQQVRAWDVLEPAVLDVMASVDRSAFTPAHLRGVAWADARIPLPHGQEMLAPKIVGRALQALAIRPSDNILQVGTGTGYVTECLARLGGQVLSIDIFDDFTREAEANLAASDRPALRLETRDAMTLDAKNRYDVILLTGSLPVMDARFEEALTEGGRLFAVVGEAPIMEARLITRVAGDEWVSESLFETLLPALINATAPERFDF